MCCVVVVVVGSSGPVEWWGWWKQVLIWSMVVVGFVMVVGIGGVVAVAAVVGVVGTVEGWKWMKWELPVGQADVMVMVECVEVECVEADLRLDGPLCHVRWWDVIEGVVEGWLQKLVGAGHWS